MLMPWFTMPEAMGQVFDVIDIRDEDSDLVVLFHREARESPKTGADDVM